MVAAALSTRSLEELKKEPWRLQIQAENTAEQLRNLVLKNYHVFIQSNQCASIVKDDVSRRAFRLALPLVVRAPAGGLTPVCAVC